MRSLTRAGKTESRPNWLLLLAGVVALAALVVASLVSWAVLPREIQRSGLGEEVDFWGPDPHLHVSVLDIDEVDCTFVDSSAETSARCLRVRARVRNSASDSVEFDPEKLRIVIIDGNGREIDPWGGADGRGDRFRLPITAGSDYEQEFLFSLPDDLVAPDLWIVEDTLVVRSFPQIRSSLAASKLVVPLPRSRVRALFSDRSHLPAADPEEPDPGDRK